MSETIAGRRRTGKGRTLWDRKCSRDGRDGRSPGGSGGSIAAKYGISESLENLPYGRCENNRLPGFCSFVVEGIPHSVLLVNAMNEKGLCVSSGSTCSTSSKEASHVLLALVYDEILAQGGRRITLGMDNSREDVEYAVQALTKAIVTIQMEQVSRTPRLEGKVNEI